LTEKYFLLTNFSNGKQIQKSLKNNFSEIIFQKKKHGLMLRLEMRAWLHYCNYRNACFIKNN
jgi:hypothetical protein